MTQTTRACMLALVVLGSACEQIAGSDDGMGLAPDLALAPDGGTVATDGGDDGPTTDLAGPGPDGGPISVPGETCTPTGFCFEHPSQFGISLADVWGASPTNVWAVGYSGALLHYDGTAWTITASPTRNSLLAIAGVSASDIWAVGELGTAIHYDGTAWNVVDVGAGKAMLRDVAMVSAAEVWVVGDGVLRRRTTVGGAFAAMTPIIVPTEPSYLYVADATHVWLSTFDSAQQWNGSTWTVTDLDVGVGSQRVTQWSGVGNAIYACVSQEANPLRVWDGTSWKRPALPDAVRVLALNACAVQMVSPSDVWIFGDDGIGHFDGTTWSAIDTHQQPPIRGIWTSGSSGIAVGDEGRVLARSGAAWPVQNAGSGSGYSAARSLTVNAGVEWTSVGGALLQRAGGAWQRLPHNKAEVQGLVAVDATHLWATSTSASADAVLYWNGSGFDAKASGDAQYWMNQSWKNPGSDELVFVGESGITNYTGGKFTRLVTVGVYGWVQAIAGGNGDVWAVGFGGAVWRRVPSGSFTAVAAGTTADLYAVHVVADNEVYLGGADSTLLRYDGSTFSPIPIPALRFGMNSTYQQVLGIDGSLATARGLWVLVSGGEVLELHSGQAPIIHSLCFEGNSMAFTSANELVVVGNGENVVRKKF